MSLRAAESISDLKNKRPFLPPRNKEEIVFVRHVEDLITRYNKRGLLSYTGFISDREQDLSVYACNRHKFTDFSFWGGYAGAQRKVLCIGDSKQFPISVMQVTIKNDSGVLINHRDILGSVLSLNIDRTCIGDIIPENNHPNSYCVFSLNSINEFLLSEWRSVGKWKADLILLPESTIGFDPVKSFKATVETVSSLRLDAVLSAMIKSGRNEAAKLIQIGAVQINHIEQSDVHARVYEGDVFSVKGRGKFCLQNIVGFSKKDRIIIEYYKFE